MKVTEEKITLVLPRDPKRSEGPHLSDIIRDLALRTGILDAKYEEVDHSDPTLMDIGMSWEDFYAKHQFPSMEYHVGEMVLDGLILTPDGLTLLDNEDYLDEIHVDRGTWMLEEIKCTLKSSKDAEENIRNDSPKFRMWLWQIKAYRYALNQLMWAGENPPNIARLHVLFLRGDYKGFLSKPQPRVFRLTFEDWELTENWEMITCHARAMGLIR